MYGIVSPFHTIAGTFNPLLGSPVIGSVSFANEKKLDMLKQKTAMISEIFILNKINENTFPFITLYTD